MKVPPIFLLLAGFLCAAPVPAANPPARDQQDTAAPTAADTREPLRYPFADETPAQRAERMRWWHEAKFGLFIHWGLYAIPADGEWHMRAKHVPFAEYSRLAGQFNPTKFNADEWMGYAQEAGIKYLVITAKHHDGFAMFDSKASDYNVVAATPFKRDPLAELAAACPRHGVRFGVYYSYLADWGHPGGQAGEPHWDPAYQDGDIDRYLDQVAVPQVRELMTNYGPIGELWFDNDGSRGITNARANRLFDAVKAQTKVIVDPRLVTGDFDTEEQRITPLRPVRDWEACLTVNGAWGYRPAPAKSARTLIRKMVDVWSKGGNVLLNVGPKPTGEFPDDSIERLRDIGRWLKANGESIYGSTNGPFDYLPWGRTTRKGSRLYLHVFDWPGDGVLHVPLGAEAGKASLLADPAGKALETHAANGQLDIRLPAVAPDEIDTVIAVELEGEPVPLHSLALNKPATASVDGKNARNATDNDPNTKWKPGKVTSGWLEVDLQTPQTFDTLRLGSGITHYKHFFLEYRDGQDWKTIFEDVDMAQDEYVKTFPAVRAQTVRFRFDDATGDLVLGSFELFHAR